jgi:serine phosphatase RsbU (regulator of sigma subunit)
MAGSILALVACSARLRRERRMRQLTRESAEAQAHAQVAEGMARLAEVLQRSLLTEPPELDDLDIAVRYVPAAEHVKIGGDWYDVFGAPDGRIMLVIGDVAVMIDRRQRRWRRCGICCGESARSSLVPQRMC